eukprot:128454_1
MGLFISCLTNPDPISQPTKHASPININANDNHCNNDINTNQDADINNTFQPPQTTNNDDVNGSVQPTFASVSRIQMQLTTNDILTAADLKSFRESQIQNKIENDETNHTNATSLIQNKIDDGYYDETERKLLEHTSRTAKYTVEEQSFIDAMEWKKGDMIGRGAYGTVYMGLNQSSGELMAVKEVQIVPNKGVVKKQNGVRSADQYVQSLESEIAVLSKLSHKNIVKYIGTQRDDKNLYILLEYVSGGSIASLLKTFGSFDESVVKIYTKHILEGLQYLHSHRIIHRDIKGGNILIDNNGVVKLADFGAAKKLADMSEQGQNPKSLHGTPYWMAPEVIKQTGHGRYADIWSLGCTVIEMLTGKPPWHQFKTQVSALFHIASTNKPPQLPPNLSPTARSFILQCLQRNPKHRPNSYKLLQHPFVCNVAKLAIETPNNVSLTMLSPATKQTELEYHADTYEEVNTIESVGDHSSEEIIKQNSDDKNDKMDSFCAIPLLQHHTQPTSINSNAPTQSNKSIRLRSQPSEADRKVIDQYLRAQYKTKRDHLTGEFKDSYVRGHTPDKNSSRNKLRNGQKVDIETVFRSTKVTPHSFNSPMMISDTDASNVMLINADHYM